MNNEREKLTPQVKEYVSKYMQELRAVSKSFLTEVDKNGKESARVLLLRLRKLIERMDSSNFNTSDRRFIRQAKDILLPSYQEALELLNQGDWFIARQLVEDAIVDTLTIESVTLGYYDNEPSNTKTI